MAYRGEEERRRQHDRCKNHVYGDCPHCRKSYRVIMDPQGRACCPMCLKALENIGSPPKNSGVQKGVNGAQS
jgi:hypothetical protein